MSKPHGLFELFFHHPLGSDFIKTSTGKESVNATYPVAIVMVRAIRDYYLKTGHKVESVNGKLSELLHLYF